MKSTCKFLASLLALGGAVLASAQLSDASISASAGAVSVRGSSGGWTGLEGSAARANVGFVVSDSNLPSQRKFATTPNGVQGKSFGYNEEIPNGGVSVDGKSTVTTGAFTDYSAAWTSNLRVNSSQTTAFGSGTFDPFDVTYGDLAGQVGPVELYFQSALRATDTFLDPLSNQSASYSYLLYVTDPNDNRTNVLSVSFSTATGLNVNFNSASGIKLYLLNPATANTGTPTDRTSDGTLLLSPTQTWLIEDYFNPDGTLKMDLSFGLLRTYATIPVGEPDARLFAWHADTLLNVTPQNAPSVPGPAGAAVFGLTMLGRGRRGA